MATPRMLWAKRFLRQNQCISQNDSVVTHLGQARPSLPVTPKLQILAQLDVSDG